MVGKNLWHSLVQNSWSNQSPEEGIPLGEPLLDTEFVINDQNEVCIGGSIRWCVINDEPWPDGKTSIMRNTGDIICPLTKVFECRVDDVIKFSGRKLPLSQLNAVISNIPEVVHHYVHFSSSIAGDTCLLIIAKLTDLSNEGRIVETLRSAIPHLPPIRVERVNDFPLTSHGKVDIPRLLKVPFIRRKQTCETTEEILRSMWKMHTKRQPLDDDNFILSGGDSMLALQFVADLEQRLHLSMPHLLDILLNRTFKDLNNVCTLPFQLDYSNNDIGKTSSSEMDSCVEPPEKKLCSDRMCFEVATRRGYELHCIHPHRSCILAKTYALESMDLSLTLQFQFNLEKCIDASPCAVHILESDDIFVYVGSHSGLFCCFDARKDVTKWSHRFSDRIESSAVISHCGKYIFVGCYDGYMTCLDSLSGIIQWRHRTGAEVRSSPVTSAMGIVYVASHDAHLYAITIESGDMSWSRKLGRCGILSSPALLEERKLVCAATLCGRISLMNMESGDCIREFVYEKPFFSSPVFTEKFVAIGSIDNKLLLFDLYGKLIDEHCTSGPIFSSSTFLNGSVIFGCHDTMVYCINTDNIEETSKTSNHSLMSSDSNTDKVIVSSRSYTAKDTDVITKIFAKDFDNTSVSIKGDKTLHCSSSKKTSGKEQLDNCFSCKNMQYNISALDQHNPSTSVQSTTLTSDQSNQSILYQPNQSTLNPSTLDQPNQSILDQPNQSTLDEPNQSILDQPNQSALDQSNQSTLNQPNQSILDQPNQSATGQFNQPTSGQSTLNQPNQSILDQPNQSILDQPHQSASEFHDCSISNHSDAKLIWKFKCDSRVYAVPHAFKFEGVDYVCVCSTFGTVYVLKASDGSLMTTFRCHGEVFSSPVFVNGFLFVGCRDNYLYSFLLQSCSMSKDV